MTQKTRNDEHCALVHFSTPGDASIAWAKHSLFSCIFVHEGVPIQDFPEYLELVSDGSKNIRQHFGEFLEQYGETISSYCLE